MADPSPKEERESIGARPPLRNGWQPMHLFEPTNFPDQASFLVWIVSPEFGGDMFVARWDCAFSNPTDGSAPVRIDEPKFMGEWRHMGHTAHLEPVAFRFAPPPFMALEDSVELSHLESIIDEGANIGGTAQ